MDQGGCNYSGKALKFLKGKYPEKKIGIKSEFNKLEKPD